MQRHWCNAERAWLDFEGTCSWCEMTEEQAIRQTLETSDETFRDIMDRVNRNARPDITDD